MRPLDAEAARAHRDRTSGSPPPGGAPAGTPPRPPATASAEAGSAIRAVRRAAPRAVDLGGALGGRLQLAAKEPLCPGGPHLGDRDVVRPRRRAGSRPRDPEVQPQPGRGRCRSGTWPPRCSCRPGSSPARRCRPRRGGAPRRPGRRRNHAPGREHRGALGVQQHDLEAVGLAVDRQVVADRVAEEGHVRGPRCGSCSRRSPAPSRPGRGAARTPGTSDPSPRSGRSGPGRARPCPRPAPQGRRGRRSAARRSSASWVPAVPAAGTSRTLARRVTPRSGADEKFMPLVVPLKWVPSRSAPCRESPAR